ncbi:MAG: HlyD family efflux transporter periplasmic adaptor subunit, partial [Planctomycetota bacterium]
AEFTPRVVSALAAVGGAFWMFEGNRVSLAFQMNLHETGLDKPEVQQAHGDLLQHVIQEGENRIIGPNASFGDEHRQIRNPVNNLLVMGLIRTELEVVGLVEIFQRADAAPQAQKGYLRFVEQMCEIAGDYFKSKQLRHFSDRQVMWSRLEEFTRLIHSSLDPRETAYIIANEARRLIECDRVSVALKKGWNCPIEAISGQDVVNKRSNTVRLLGNLAKVVVAGEEAVWYCGDTTNLAPQVEDAIHEYVDESHSKTVIVVPLVPPPPPVTTDEEEQEVRDAPPKPVGALIVEQIEDDRITPQLRQRVDTVVRHASVALANAVEHHELFLMPLWRALGKSKVIVAARHLPKTLLAAAAVIAFILAMIFVPWDFKVHCKGTLEPIQRRDVFAGVEGVVDEVAVRHGQQVAEGQLLVRLRNTELKQSLVEIEGQIATNLKQIAALRKELTESRMLSAQERNRLSGQLAELEARQINLTAQREVLREKEKELEVTSPMTGEVVTWDVYNRLIYRPVNRGQVLMRVADTSDGWQLELQMPEYRIGDVTKARQRLRNDNPDDDLSVEFVLATEPGKTHIGKITEIHMAAEVMGEEGNVVLIKVAVDEDEFDPSELRPGATVSAKILCGKKPLGYVWFHDVIAFIQTRILFGLW